MVTYTEGRRGRQLLLNVLAILICAIFLFPLYWMIVTSFKTEVDIFRTPPSLFPTYFYPDSYIQQFSGEYSTLQAFRNSCVISVGAMAISTLLGVPAAYALARFRFRGRRVFILTFLVTQMLPATLLLTPLFIIFKNLSMLDTWYAAMVADATIGIPFVILILRTYFLSIPKELDEAARIDGCGAVSAFARIMIPIAFPGVIVSMVFSLLYAWGDLIYGMTFINKEQLRPITAGIYVYITRYGTSWNLLMAFGIVAILPVLFIFIFMQNHIVSGLTSGAVKG